MSKKIYITESQFNELMESKKNNKKKSKKDFEMDYVKANRKGRREEERERYGDGFKPTTRVSKSEKSYSRKGKNKNWKNFSDDE
jgi:hypothetical protein